MIDIIISKLQKNNISNYIINDTKTESVELFFIKKSLDMRRCKDVHKYSVTVFNDFENDGDKKRGSSTAIIHPGMSDDEISKAILDAYYAASFVSNPYFELPDACNEKNIVMESNLKNIPLEDCVLKMSEAMFKEDTCKDSLINSAELFAQKTTEAIFSSKGTDVSYIKYNVNGEFVVQCVSPQDVELYENFSYDNLDAEALSYKVKESLETVAARAKATKAPLAGEYTILLSGKHVRELLGFYINRSAANMIYPKYSKYSIGTHVQGELISGEALNIELVSSVPYSSEGIKMINRRLINHGNLEAIHGSNRFCRYLGIEPTGLYSSIMVDNGTVSFEEMKKNKCLHIVSFSDFQTDPYSGHFGGEIRLAYLYDGDNTTVLTGGSINGNLLELQNNLIFSTERYKYSAYDGPYAIRLERVKIAGV